MSTETMTSRERLLAAMKREPVDRVPIHLWGANLQTEIIHPSFQPILDLALEKTDLIGTWGMPRKPGTGGEPLETTTKVGPSTVEDYQEHVTTWQTPAGPLTTIHYGSTIGKPPYCKKYLVESVEDAKRWMSIPYEPNRGDVSGFHERVQEMGDRGLVMVGFGEPMYRVQSTMGTETFAMWSVYQRDLLREMMDRAYRMLYDYLEYVLSAGLGPLYGFVGPEVCVPPFQSPADFQEFVVDYDKKLIEMIHSHDCLVWCHCHGKVGQVLDGFLEMAPDILNPLEPPPQGDVTLAEAKAKIGHRITLEGNIQKDEIYRASTKRIRRLVREAIGDAAPGGGFILCPSAGFHEWIHASEQNVANYEAFVDEGLKAGRYPIQV